MAKPLLSLGLTPIKAGKFLAATPAFVCFTSNQSLQNAPISFERDDGHWDSQMLNYDYRKTNDFLNRIQDARVAGTNLIEFLSYDNISMWQFLPSYLWPFFLRTVELIRVVSQIVDEVNPEKIRLFPVNDYTSHIWRGIVRAVAKARGIQVVDIKPPNQKWNFPGTIRQLLRDTDLIHPIHKAQHLLFVLSMRLISRLHRKKNQNTYIGKKLLFATSERYWVGLPGALWQKYDEQLFPILPALRSEKWTQVVGIDCPYNSRWSIAQKLWERRKDNEPGVFWRSFYDYGNIVYLRGIKEKAKIAFSEKWKILGNDHEFAENFQYLGVSLLPALHQEFQRAFHEILPKCVEMLAIAEEILREEHPDAVMATYETGPFQRALIIQAGRAGIPTVGLMHGMIFDNHPDYMHRRISTDPVANPLGFIVPKATCVWGAFTKKNLTTTGTYPPDAVAVTGNWRHDHIVEKFLTKDTAEFKKKSGATEKERIVLILSAGQNILDYISQCLKALAMRSECKPLVKLHPSDDPVPVSKMLKELGYSTNTLIDGQLIEALSISDLVISQWSTAVSEAALLDRPVVLVDFYDLPGYESFVDAGICLLAKTPEALLKAIEEGLKDSSILAQMSAARKAFVSKFFYKIDGHAAQRVVSILSKMCTAPQKLDHSHASEPTF